VMWVMRFGIVEHAAWYPTLNIFSTFEDIQAELNSRRECHCEAPCPPAADLSKVGALPASASTLQSLGSNSTEPHPLAELAGALVEQVTETAITPLLCNPAVQMASAAVAFTASLFAPAEDNATSAVWHLPDDEKDRCFDMLLEKRFVKPEDRKLERNWCWVGMKEVGCHWHQYDHLTWEGMQERAVADNGTSKVPFSPLRNPEVCDRSVHGGPRRWTRLDWTFAKQWFQNNVGLYVLSLRTSTERRNIIKRRLADLEIPFEFVDGIDMREKSALDVAKREGLIPKAFNISKAQAEAYMPRQNMGTTGSIVGTIGCAAGHFRAQRRGHADGKELTVVLEDDVSPVDDFMPKLWQLVTQELPCDWQAVSLNSRCPFGACISPHLTRVQPDVNEPAWRCYHGVNYGFQGVLYRLQGLEELQQRWKRVVFNESRPHCLDVDVALASMSDSVGFYAVPFVQYPGFLTEVQMTSSRFSINQIKT